MSRLTILHLLYVFLYPVPPNKRIEVACSNLKSCSAVSLECYCYILSAWLHFNKKLGSELPLSRLIMIKSITAIIAGTYLSIHQN